MSRIEKRASARKNLEFLAASFEAAAKPERLLQQLLAERPREAEQIRRAWRLYKAACLV